MSGNEAVIDNEKVIFLDQLRDLLPDTNRASIAVGYFFISGFGAIMDSLKRIESSNNPNHVLRLLIHIIWRMFLSRPRFTNNICHIACELLAAGIVPMTVKPS